MSVAMPVNAIAACKRLIELLDEHNENSLLGYGARKDWRIRAIVWFLTQQLTGIEIGKIDMSELYSQIEALKQ